MIVNVEIWYADATVPLPITKEYDIINFETLVPEKQVDLISDEVYKDPDFEGRFDLTFKIKTT